MGQIFDLWIRVPLRALERAIEALKERVARRHVEASIESDAARERRLREAADQDDAAAEQLRKAIREDDDTPPPK